jgi:AraC-like DNA-binding protein
LLYSFLNDCNEDLAYELICDWIFQVNPDSKTFKYQKWIKKVVSIVENELDEFHTLDGLSERVFVHPTYLARAFKEKIGLTIGEYQIKSKLSNAINLLLNTSLSISEISYKNGFYDDAHFIRRFKSVYNVSPHQFRLTIKK